MRLLCLTRFRAFAMLLALGLGLAAQFAATAAMAGPMATASGPELSAASMCPGCGSSNSSDVGMVAQCATVFCASFIAVAPSSPLLARIEPERFVAALDQGSTGLAPRPDPYPPRTSLHS